MDRRRFLQLTVAAPFIVKGAVMAVQATPAPAAITRAKYADLFVKKLPFMDEILVSSYMTDDDSWFLLPGNRSGKTETSTMEFIRRLRRGPAPESTDDLSYRVKKNY